MYNSIFFRYFWINRRFLSSNRINMQFYTVHIVTLSSLCQPWIILFRHFHHSLNPFGSLVRLPLWFRHTGKASPITYFAHRINKKGPAETDSEVEHNTGREAAHLGCVIFLHYAEWRNFYIKPECPVSALCHDVEVDRVWFDVFVEVLHLFLSQAVFGFHAAICFDTDNRTERKEYRPL